MLAMCKQVRRGHFAKMQSQKRKIAKKKQKKKEKGKPKQGKFVRRARKIFARILGRGISKRLRCLQAARKAPIEGKKSGYWPRTDCAGATWRRPCRCVAGGLANHWQAGQKPALR